MTKKCTKCLIVKEITAFGLYTGRAKKKLMYPWCRPCMNAKCKAWTINNKDRVFGTRLKKYWPGSTWQEALANYMNLLEKQNNTCAICNQPELMKNVKLAVDHSHKTGKVRGLLCGNCNHAVGKLKDNGLLFMKAIVYLEVAA